MSVTILPLRVEVIISLFCSSNGRGGTNSNAYLNANFLLSPLFLVFLVKADTWLNCVYIKLIVPSAEL